MSRLCPSAQPGMDRCQVLGVVDRDGPQPMVLYLKTPMPATPEVLALSAPMKPTEVFRLSATCAEGGCPHYDGRDCQLATRVVRMLPSIVDGLPPCPIRKECRWFSQEGRAACLRCPQVTTVTHDLSEHTRQVSGLPVMTDARRATTMTTPLPGPAASPHP